MGDTENIKDNLGEEEAAEKDTETTADEKAETAGKSSSDDDEADAAAEYNDTASEYADMEEALAEANDKYVRLFAEYDNYRKRTAKEKAEKLLADVEFAGEMVEVTDENMELRLGFTADGLTDYVAYTCGSGAFPDEFGVFVAESQTKANEVKTALESRIETQKSTYQDYTPEEMYKFDDCFVKLNGTTVYYAITADNTKAEEILK